MRIAVITPYYREPDEVLEQCHRSVLGQTVTCDHFLIADGWPNPTVRNWRVQHFELPEAHGHGGNLPRVLGSISAFSRGYDVVAFLDADNWYDPSHIERLAELHVRTGAAVCTSNRTMHRLDGSYMFEDDKSDGRTHVDTSCLFLTRAALPVITRWALIPRELGAICDTIYWSSIRSFGLSRAHGQAPTMCFRTTYEADYRRLGEALPGCAKSLQDTDRPFYWFKSLPAKERWRIWKDLGWPTGLHRVAILRSSYALTRLSDICLRRASA